MTSFLIGIGYWMTSLKRRFERSHCLVGNVRVGLKRTLILLGKQRSNKTQVEEHCHRLIRKRTWEKSSALHVTNMDTMQVNVRTRRARGRHLWLYLHRWM